MAIYHCNVRVFSRSKGKSAVKEAAYVSGSCFTDATGRVFDYTQKPGVVYSEFLWPEGFNGFNIHANVSWRKVEAAENRKDAQLAREVVLALPVELSFEQQCALINEFVDSTFLSKGMVAYVNMHRENDWNPHVHIMLTLRKPILSVLQVKRSVSRLDYESSLRLWRHENVPEAQLVIYSPAKFYWECHYRNTEGEFCRELSMGHPNEENDLYALLSRVDGDQLLEHESSQLRMLLESIGCGPAFSFSEKERSWNSRDFIKSTRETWCTLQNQHLASAGSDAFVNHQSHKARGMLKAPQLHLGPSAHQMQKRGVKTVRGELYAERERFNENLLKDRKEAALQLRELLLEEELRLREETVSVTPLQDVCFTSSFSR